MPAVSASTAKRDKRRHPRRALLASVEVTLAKGTLLLPVRNLSLGGVSLAGAGADLARLELGAILPVQVFDISDGTRAPVRASARVMRHDRDAVALMWTGDDPRTMTELAELLEALKPHH